LRWQPVLAPPLSGRLRRSTECQYPLGDASHRQRSGYETRRRNWPAGELRRELQQEQREKARGGRRVDAVLSAVRHGPFVRKLYEERATIYLDEVRDALGRRFGRSRGRPGAVSRSTLCRFVKHRLGLSRRRSCAGVTGDNHRRRRENWFDKNVDSSSSWDARRARGSAKMADAPT